MTSVEYFTKYLQRDFLLVPRKDIAMRMAYKQKPNKEKKMKKTVLTVLIIPFLAGSAMAGSDVQLPTPTGSTIIGERAGDYAAESVISVGDMTGDYLPEVAVSVRNSPTSDHSGMVAIFKGKAEGLPVNSSIANADIKIMGTPFTWTGSKIFAAGDLDGDRLNDLAFTSDTNFYLYRGTKTPTATVSISNIGTTVRGVKFIGPAGSDIANNMKFADVDGDGKTDIIYTLTDVYIISGKAIPDSGTLVVNDGFFNGINGYRIVLSGVTAGSKTDIALSDVDRNGVKDLIIANQNQLNSKAYLMLNLKSPLPAVTTLSDSYFNGNNGTAFNTIIAVNANLVHAIGDVNGDSFNDILFSGLQYPGMSDMIMVPGRAVWPAYIDLQTDTSMKRIKGIGPLNINATPAVSIAGDHNGDGIQDFIVGDPTKNRAVIIEVGTNWPAVYTVTDIVQSTNTKLIGPQGTGSSVGFAENLFGGIGCATDLSYVIGANFGSSIGKAFVVNLKR